MKPIRLVVTVAVAAIAAVPGCKKTPAGPSDVTAVVTGIATASAAPIAAVQRPGAPPAASGGPPATLTGPGTAVNGGGNSYGVVSPVPFKKILVAVSTSSGAADGFFESTLATETISQAIVLSYGPSLSVPSFDAKFQVVTASGLVGPEAIVRTSVVSQSQATASLSAVITPDPAPFLNGAACFLFPGAVCVYEFQIALREHNGVSVTFTSAQESFMAGSGPHAPAFTATTIPGRGTTNLLRGVICLTGEASCIPGIAAGFSQPQIYSGSYSGTDANGHQITFSTSVNLLPK